MKRALQLCWRGARLCTAGGLTFALWSLWLGLVLLLGVQAYVARSHELALPGFVLSTLEERLAASGVHLTFGRTSFDPHGRVLIEDLRLSLPAFDEPVVTARSLYARLDPWKLLVGRVEPVEIRLSGATLLTPAMLSPSGRAEQIVHDLDASITPHEQEFAINWCHGRLGELALIVHGSVHVAGATRGARAPLPAADFLAKNYAALMRQAAGAIEQLSVFQEPIVEIDLAPSEARGAIASALLHAAGLRLEAPVALSATRLTLATKLPLLGEAPVMATLAFETDELRLPRGVVILGARALLRGVLRPTQLTFEATDVSVAATSATAGNLTAESPFATLTPGPLPRLRAEVATRLGGQRIALDAAVDVKAQTADVRFDGAFSPTLLEPLEQALGKDVRRFVDFKSPVILAGTARFDAGWHFARLVSRVSARDVLAYRVAIDEARGLVEFDGRRFDAPEAYARIGKNFAAGSYAQDLVTRDYRFLLEGRLRPIDISGWFQKWWPDFFEGFGFPDLPPEASVDVSGRWGVGRESAVFVAARSDHAIVRGAEWDRVRTRLFFRPNFTQGLQLDLARGPRALHGTFARRYDLNAANWRSFDFDFAGDIDPAEAVKFFGPSGAALVAPFSFARPPTLKVRGHLDGPAAPGGPHSALRVDATTDGAFRFQDFPIDAATVTVELRDDEMTLEPLKLSFAGGEATGRARLWGRDAARRLSFEGELKDAGLGRVIAELEGFSARHRGAPPPPPNRFMKERSDIQLDLSAKAEGRLTDALSYTGEGRAGLNGAELGEVRLLGVFSEVLRFTSLRFTSARANFRIEGPRLVFPDVKVTGANSAIDAKGTYALDKRELDFNAKVYPLQESKNPLKAVVGLALTPLSIISEVRLSGSLDKPEAHLVFGPANLLRNLASPDDPAKPAVPEPVPPAAEPVATPPKT